MRIPRINRQTALYDSPLDKNSNASNVGNTGREERAVSGGEPRDDFGDCKVAEVGCELNTLQGEYFNTPYELYDLPDLRDILSLETWNSCLVEEERFALSAYLPDMDQQTFWSTLRDLLGGKDLFFGSPLAVFFRNLKGGLYHEKVSCNRSCLQFLQRLAFCHSLRSYHENLVRSFSKMKRLWDPYLPSIDVKERISIWKAGRNHSKGVFLFDLNSYPDDDDDSIDCKRVNPITAPHFMSSETELDPSNNLSAHQTCTSKPELSDDYVLCFPPQKKGVLKMCSKGSTTQRELPRTIPMQSEVPVSSTSRSLLLQPPVHGCGEWNHKGSSFPVQKVDGKVYHRSPDVPNCVMKRQRVISVKDTTLPVRSFQSAIKYAHPTKDASRGFVTYSRRDNLFRGNSETISERGDYSKNPTPSRRYYCESENYSDNSVQQSREHPLSSLEGSQFDSGYHNRASLDVSDRATKKSTFSTGDHVDGGGARKLYDLSAVAFGVSDRSMSPKTYKRRKVQTERR